jgi:DNA-binding transcriptional regulator YiaG
MSLQNLLERARAHRGLPDPELCRVIREGAGLSQGDIAQAVGVRRETVSRWETGARAPRGEFLVKYREVLEAVKRA